MGAEPEVDTEGRQDDPGEAVNDHVLRDVEAIALMADLTASAKAELHQVAAMTAEYLKAQADLGIPASVAGPSAVHHAQAYWSARMQSAFEVPA